VDDEPDAFDGLDIFRWGARLSWSPTAQDTVLGLNVPEDPMAVVSYVEVDDGSLTVDLAHTHYSGGNKGMALGAPQLELFVYAVENHGVNGELDVLAKDQVVQGTASVSVEAPETDTVFVVTKLVEVLGGVNTNDIQSVFTLECSYTAVELPAFTLGGSRMDDGSALTSGQSPKSTSSSTASPIASTRSSSTASFPTAGP
jgi:hypothetical protein